MSTIENGAYWLMEKRAAYDKLPKFRFYRHDFNRMSKGFFFTWGLREFEKVNEGDFCYKNHISFSWEINPSPLFRTLWDVINRRIPKLRWRFHVS